MLSGLCSVAFSLPVIKNDAVAIDESMERRDMLPTKKTQRHGSAQYIELFGELTEFARIYDRKISSKTFKGYHGGLYVPRE